MTLLSPKLAIVSSLPLPYCNYKFLLSGLEHPIRMPHKYRHKIISSVCKWMKYKIVQFGYRTHLQVIFPISKLLMYMMYYFVELVQNQ